MPQIAALSASLFSSIEADIQASIPEIAVIHDGRPREEQLSLPYAVVSIQEIDLSPNGLAALSMTISARVYFVFAYPQDSKTTIRDQIARRLDPFIRQFEAHVTWPNGGYLGNINKVHIDEVNHEGKVGAMIGLRIVYDALRGT